MCLDSIKILSYQLFSVYESYIVFDGKYVWIIYIVVINRKDHHNFQPWYQDGDGGGGGGDGGGGLVIKGIKLS